MTGDGEARRSLVVWLLVDAGVGAVADVHRLGGGSFGEVWRAAADSGPVVVRFCPARPNSYERERRVLRSLEGSGLPVPEVLGVNDEHRVLVLTGLPGVTVCLTDDPHPVAVAVAVAVARVLADLHRQDPDNSLLTASRSTSCAVGVSRSSWTIRLLTRSMENRLLTTRPRYCRSGIAS